MPSPKTNPSQSPRPLKKAGSTHELVTMVMARMRDDEAKLIRQIKKLIKQRRSYAVQILTSTIDGWMPLHACVLRGSKKLLKVFLNSGVDVNTQMDQPDGLPDKCSPLHMACLRGDKDIVNMLLSKGADISAVDNRNSTPLTYAVSRKHHQVVRLLAKQGTNRKPCIVHIDIEDCMTPKPTLNKFCFKLF